MWHINSIEVIKLNLLTGMIYFFCNFSFQYVVWIYQLVAP